MPIAIRTPIIAPMTATILLIIIPLKHNGDGPKNTRSPANQKNRVKTNNPTIMSIAPTALLLPEPKYEVNIPKIKLAAANESIIILNR